MVDLPARQQTNETQPLTFMSDQLERAAHVDHRITTRVRVHADQHSVCKSDLSIF
jgi:hypothetical protein